MGFEKWVPQADFESIPASATIVQSRLIRLTAPVADMLNLRGENHASLFFDRRKQIIGIKISDKKEEGSAKVRQSEKSTSIHIPKFFRDYEIEIPGIKRFQCWYDEEQDMAMIDISNPSPRGRPKGT